VYGLAFVADGWRVYFPVHALALAASRSTAALEQIRQQMRACNISRSPVFGGERRCYECPPAPISLRAGGSSVEVLMIQTIFPTVRRGTLRRSVAKSGSRASQPPHRPRVAGPRAGGLWAEGSRARPQRSEDGRGRRTMQGPAGPRTRDPTPTPRSVQGPAGPRTRDPTPPHGPCRVPPALGPATPLQPTVRAGSRRPAGGKSSSRW
jgi:hypothetical protein